ncbi:MAG: DUF4469 domain-containing protein [Dysgonamonadaceae bacterium]|nr:DUF4469 domain-containing protein [Dysgonamonadaceae bacterium]
MLAVNDPSRILFIAPATLVDGTYELSVVTQFTGANKTLKHPRSVSLCYQVMVC